jgi:uncharacterized protein (TIGR02687 family)
MNLAEVKKSLDKMFARELKQGSRRNIVFWYDEAGAFSEEVDSLALENAKIVRLSDNNIFATKMYIERENTEGNLLVYSPLPRPTNRENWLTDVIKYSQTFSTDEASLILLNYKMDGALRPVVNLYKAFFRNNERVRRFESYGVSDFTANRLDIAILSALCKQGAPNFDACIREILSEIAREETSLVDTIGKFGSLDRLWLLIEKAYGYRFEEKNFEKLAILLLVTHLSQSFDKLPRDWSLYESDNTNGFVFVDSFMKNMDYKNQYDALARFASEKLRMAEQIKHWNIDDIIECDTFREFDTAILGRLLDLIMSDTGEYEHYRKIINNRRNRRWFPDFETEYLTLLYACEFLGLFGKHDGFAATDSSKMWKLYESELYKFDYYYRKFVNNFDSLADKEEYRQLANKVECAYNIHFLNELSVKWCDALDEKKRDDGAIDWNIAGIVGQERFYDTCVQKYVQSDERVVVIVSDALRYESASELLEILNCKHKGTSELTSMLGVIPSYTALGMAALLPHKTIEISDNGVISADGISTQGTENRKKILRQYKSEAIAIAFENLAAMSKQQMADTFGGVKLIYVYHNAIDARGDNAATEREVFDATDKALRELSTLVRTLENNISAINFLITADHGYIYRRTPLLQSDKTPKETEDSIEAKRRFIMTRQKIELQSTQRFSMKYLGNCEITTVVPRGANCFKIQGAGANYVHGGSALQEVMIPLVKYKSGKNIAKAELARKVSLSLTSITRKVTSVITHLNFFQNEPVEDKLLPLRVKVFFEDENGGRISNENIIIAESTSQNREERAYKEKFTLRNIAYDKSKSYYLVIKDDEETIEREIERIPFIIDLVFGGGIQF